MTELQEVRWVEELAGKARHEKPVTDPLLLARVNLYRLPGLRNLLMSRWPQFILRSVTVIGLAFTLATAIFGTGVGSHNFAIIIVWIAWWTTLKLGFIPLGGRSWCSICPIPLPGEWLQRGAILENSRHPHGLNLRWPKILRGSWLQSAAFLLIGAFSALTLTDPHITGWVLLALVVLAAAMSLVFEHRSFCSYICPIGGFSGIYAKAAPLEVRVLDKDICVQHAEKTCYQACPWGLYPLALKDSSSCGLCLECLRACPKDNLALNLRPYGSDIARVEHSPRLDDAFLALVMLGSAVVFSAVFIGPWGWLKLAAYHIGSRAWVAYTVGFLALTVIFIPALFTLGVWIWKKICSSNQPLKRLLGRYAQGLLPMGLLAWIAFTVSFALPKLNLIFGVLNDPFGWGWHLLNLAAAPSAIDVSGFSSYLQVILLALGVFWSARETQKLAKLDGKGTSPANIPLMAFYLLYSGALLWILIG